MHYMIDLLWEVLLYGITYLAGGFIQDISQLFKVQSACQFEQFRVKYLAQPHSNDR